MKGNFKVRLRWLPPLILISGLFAAGACSSNPTYRRQQKALAEVIAERGLDPNEVVVDGLSKEMRTWLRDRVPKQGGAYERLLGLIEALNNPYAIQLEYEAGYTGTAEDVFTTGRFNCLSYSHLFLGLARELGVDVHYMSVDWIRRFRQQGDLVLVSGHVTVGYGAGTDQKILHFNVGADINYRTAVPISDLTAMALHYANRGAELIQVGDLELALTALETSRRLDPTLPDSWVNLGVTRRRLGDLDGAEAAYLRATEIDPEFFPAYRNLATIYDLRGEEDALLHTLEVLDRRGNRNPYAFLALGDANRERGDLDEAERLYRRALRLSEEPADAMAALGLLAVARVDLDGARSWLDKARSADPKAPRVIELQITLDSATEGSVVDGKVTLE